MVKCIINAFSVYLFDSDTWKHHHWHELVNVIDVIMNYMKYSG